MPPAKRPLLAPAPPRALIAQAAHASFAAHIAKYQSELETRRKGFQEANAAGRSAENHAALALHRRHNGDPDGASAALAAAAQSLSVAQKWVAEQTSDAAGQEQDGGFFSGASQNIVSAQAFESFLATGALGPRPAPTACTDEEWLGGLISASHEIGRYASNAATAGDTASVRASAAVVAALHEELEAFDFRNGGLRRSFDSLKYVVRRLEDTLYELSLFPPADAASDAGAVPADAAPADAAQLLDVEALEAARQAYAALDAAREALIKRCREPQKLSKQAIFALQRGDGRGARKQLGAAATLCRAVLDEDIAAAPSLRSQGCVHSMLEEYAEAALFAAWLGEATDGAAGGGGAAGAAAAGGAAPAAARVLLLRGDDALLGGALTPSEYLGGVCDLVGEMGRFAVRRATERDASAVREALASAVAVQAALLALGDALPRAVGKKLDALRTSVRKLEQLLYELSLVQRSGRTRAAPEPVPEPGGGAADAAMADA